MAAGGSRPRELDKSRIVVEMKQMSLKAFVLFQLMAIAPVVLADETLSTLRAGTLVYSNVSVMKVSATDVYFTYTRDNGIGMANAKLKDLDPALQKHFNYNAANAAAVEDKQARSNTQYHSLLISPPVPQPSVAHPGQSADTGAPEALWRTDLPGALSQARSENKLVLLDFTGSDWCPWCIKFDQEVLSTSQFAGYANAKLILVKLDFPHSIPQSDDLKRANAALAQQFKVDGYPTYVLLNADGSELGRQVGYREGGPNAFISELGGFSRR